MTNLVREQLVDTNIVKVEGVTQFRLCVNDPLTPTQNSLSF